MSTLATDARLAEVAVVQHGVFTRAQAMASGFSASQIERRVRARAWERVLPGVYQHAATPASTARAYWAAVLWAGPECALSHASAAAIWRIHVERRLLHLPDRRSVAKGAARRARALIS